MLVGAIADDLTGATDLAGALVRVGLRTAFCIGPVPPDASFPDADAVVVALKSRTAPPVDAVDWSVAAARALCADGATRLLFKYCSTFDSTPQGNIGPVADALIDATGARGTVHCPAFPTNGRTVYRSHLFVGDDLLSESPMRDHPLTPMRDSNLVRVLGAQTPRAVGAITEPTIARGANAVATAVDRLHAGGTPHVIVDTVDDRDLTTIADAADALALVCGGSAVGAALAARWITTGLATASPPAAIAPAPGPGAIVSGSCSAATRAQLAAVEADHVIVRVDAHAAVTDPIPEIERVARAAVDALGTQAVVVASTDTPDAVARVQALRGAGDVGAAVEHVLARVAVALVDAGVRRLVVAGGETSGAVLHALGAPALRIGAEIAPGVPWTITDDGRELALALKSGNFGGDDFFRRAFEVLG